MNKNNESILNTIKVVNKPSSFNGKTIDEEKLLPTEVINEIMTTGLIICGSKGSGKSNVAKFITSQIIKRNLEIQCKIFDSCSNWRHGFEPIIMQELNETNTLDVVYAGKKHILFDVEYSDPIDIQREIGYIVQQDFTRNRMQKKIYGNIKDWKLYCIEEAQNVLNGYSLNKKDGRFWLKAISEGRNFNLAFMFIGQRLADISTKVIERCQGYLLGRMTGDNDKNKIKRICGKDSNIHNKVSSLKQGEFIYFNGNKTMMLRSPKYISTSKPKLFSPSLGIWQDMCVTTNLSERFNSNSSITPVTESE